MSIDSLKFIYFLSIRKIYKKRIKDRGVASANLALIMLTLNIVGIIFIIEFLLPVKGLIFYFTGDNLPAGPLGILIFGVGTLVYYLFFYKNKKNKVQVIRIAYSKSKLIKKYHVILYLVFSVIFLGLSLILASSKY